MTSLGRSFLPGKSDWYSFQAGFCEVAFNVVIARKLCGLFTFLPS